MTDVLSRAPRIDHKLGKKPARPRQVKLKFDRYRKAVLLPKIPATFGHYAALEGQQLGVLGNDAYGDCVQAGAAHIVMLWYAEQNKAIRFTEANTLMDYEVATGFNPLDPVSDQGTDMSQYADFWRKTGIRDGDGKAHFLAAYLRLDVSSLQQVNEACYFFGTVGLGVQLPASAMDQFDAGQPWDVPLSGEQILGGHYVPLVGFDGTFYYVVTWGKLQKVTGAFLNRYLDEALAYLSEDMLSGGLSIDGFNLDQLRSDLALI